MFRIFPFPVVEGDPASTIALPDGIVVTQGVAEAYFGRTSGLGRTPMIVQATVDEHFFGTYRARLLAGRIFDPDRFALEVGNSGTGSQAFAGRVANIMLNRTAAQRLGFDQAEEAIGQIVSLDGAMVRIVGVIADLRFGTPREPRSPTTLSSTLRVAGTARPHSRSQAPSVVGLALYIRQVSCYLHTHRAQRLRMSVGGRFAVARKSISNMAPCASDLRIKIVSRFSRSVLDAKLVIFASTTREVVVSRRSVRPVWLRIVLAA